MPELTFYMKSLAGCGPSIGCLDGICAIKEGKWNEEESIVCDWSPDMSFMPPRKFRRLSRLSKMALYAAHHASMGGGQASIGAPIFCSRYGELQHTVQVLDAIISEEPVSPMDFSYSVYNTGQGLFSILNEDERPATAISSREFIIEEAMVKATAQLFAGDESVLIVYHEDQLPEVYEELLNLEVLPISFAFVVSHDCKEALQKITLSSKPKSKVEAEETNISTRISNRHERNIFKLLANKKSEVLIGGKRLNWRWCCESL